MELILDEVRVRVSSLVCKLLVQVMFIACFILVFAYLLIYSSNVLVSTSMNQLNK